MVKHDLHKFETFKICTKCGKTKPESEFSKQKAGRGGLCAQCKACCNERNRKSYAEDPEKKLRTHRKWVKENPEKRLAINRKCAKKTRLSRILSASRCYAKKNGYFPCDATVEELRASQTGRCFICGTHELELTRRLTMDHDHDIETDNFRGWLCYRCNTMLGMACDSRKILVSALHYLTHCRVKQK